MSPPGSRAVLALGPLLILIQGLGLGLGACAASSPGPESAVVQTPAADVAASVPVRPARLLHLVFFRLVDKADSEALLVDCQELLPSIPGVVAYAAGRHLETGRASVDGDYDLALLVGFADLPAYQLYLGHSQHLELLSRWKDRLASYTIHDVRDQPVP